MAKGKTTKRVSKQAEDDGRLTLQVLDAISSDEDEGSDGVGNEEWNAEALALRQAVAEGAFNHLLKSKTRMQDSDNQEEDFIEISIEEGRSHKKCPTNTEHDPGEINEEDQSDDAESDDETSKRIIADYNGKALKAVYEELCTKKRGMAWSESFVVLAERPLPFGGDGAGSPLDVHDDLKRELAFYNMALDAVSEARMACQQVGIPFPRPDDFFAEMVKTDGKSEPFFLP
jgi:rRNA-processing protein EBP2